MKKIFTLICCLFVLACPVLAENFYIENYDVNINVNKNKSAAIVENLDVYFTRPSHGIFRDIQVKNATVTNINVSEQAKTTFAGSNINIKIGNPNEYVSGRHHYTIRYNYNYSDNKNEFYHNIIGTGWNTNINRAKFDITMPENVKASDVGLSIGSQGTKGFKDRAIYYVNGNHIYGQILAPLRNNEGITIRVEVPNGYFVKQINYARAFTITLMVLITLIASIIWFFYGKDEPVIPIVNFYPPDNLNPIELELAYKGNASVKGLVGLLVDLARQGYIKIYCQKEDWAIQKIKEYDGNDKFCKSYIKALFGQTKYITKAALTKSKIFYKDCEKILNSVNDDRAKIFNKDSISFPLQAIMFLCLVGLYALTVLSVFSYNIPAVIDNIPILLFPIIAIIAIISSIKSLNISTVIFALCFGGFPFLLLGTDFNNMDIPVLVVGIIAIVITAICFYQLPQRNKVGQMLLNNIEGFKHFLEVSEKNKLQTLVESDPEYFYKILPYTYVLGISEKWISKFEEMMPINPDWYNGETLSWRSFSHFTNGMMSVSIPTTQNGGISSSTSSSGGGGFSGGGGGGGGGGSW